MDHQVTFNRILIVRKPYARLIVQGLKTWEMRTSMTKVRGRIGIAESGSGCVIGEVDLIDSLTAIDTATATATATFDKHRVNNPQLLCSTNCSRGFKHI